MLGFRLLKNTEIDLQQRLTDARIAALEAELKAAKEYIGKCERLIEHERERIDAERERADRIADSLFQSSGLPATSATVIAEQKHAEFEAADKREDYMKQLADIYGETMDEMIEDGAEPMPEPIDELVSK